MTPEQLLANLQEEVKGLAETVQRLSAENMVLKSQTSSETVRSVTMANEIARLNKPSVFAGTEDEFGDWDFALTCFVGTMDGTLVQELQAISSDPVMKRTPTDDAGKEKARTLYNILALLTTKGPRKMVREVPEQNGHEAHRCLAMRYGSRGAHGETTLSIRVMNFNFGDIEAVESKFEEFNLLVTEHDDIPGIDNIPDTIKRAILVARSPEPLRTHLSYATFLDMRKAINQYLRARKGFKLKERDDDPMEVDLVHRESFRDKRERKIKGQRKAQEQRKRQGQTQ